MKKLAAFMIAVLTLACAAVPAAGEGIYVAAENGNMIRILENSEIDSPVEGNVISILGDISVNSGVDGHVVAVFGDIAVNSGVDGHVVTIFGKTTLGEPAVVSGDVITIGRLDKFPGSRILGKEVRVLGKSMNLDIGAITYLQLVVMLLFMIAVFFAGFLLLLISRTKYVEIASNLEKNIGRKITLGVLSFMGATALMLLLLLTLISPVLYIVVILLSNITAGMFFGRLILRSFSRKNSIFTEFTTGLITLTLAKLLVVFLVPNHEIIARFCLLALIDLVICSVGLGIHVEHYYMGHDKKQVEMK